MSGALLIGRVWHRRLMPVENAFTYPIVQIEVPIGRADEIARPWLSVNRFNLFAFHETDHGNRDGTSLLAWIRQLLANNDLAWLDGEIRLQTMPRMLGYVFNPISFWLCHDSAGELRAVVCEVNNTFGATHSYLVRHADQRPIAGSDRFDSHKQLHVSPFCKVEGDYGFRFRIDADSARINIDYRVDGALLLQTAITTRREPLTGTNLLRAFLRFRWNTLATSLRIHYQALRLWHKGVTFHGHVPPPSSHGNHS